jgi:polyferredoxin
LAEVNFMASTPAGPALRAQTAPLAGRRKLVRRRARDSSQRLRLTMQAAFLALNVWLGIQFYLFIHYYESGGRGWHMTRPAGVDGWLPIGGLMNLKYFILTGSFPAVHPAAMVLLSAFLIVSLLFRKAFCGWLCPVGTLSEGLWKLGKRYLKYNWRLPRWADYALRSLKYILLGLFLYAVTSMSAGAIRSFLESPYGLVADVKMLDFFRYMGVSTAVTLLLLVVLSIMIKNFWCRYLCPYGALMGLAALASPARIRRNPNRCIDCAKCAVACPALLAVDKKLSVMSAECMACMECVAVCPAEGALEMAGPLRRTIPAWALAAGVAVVFVGIIAAAKLSGHWQTMIPDQVYFYLIPQAHRFVHP